MTRAPRQTKARGAPFHFELLENEGRRKKKNNSKRPGRCIGNLMIVLFVAVVVLVATHESGAVDFLSPHSIIGKSILLIIINPP